MATQFAQFLQSHFITAKRLALWSGVAEVDIEDIKRNGAKNIQNINMGRIFQTLELMVRRPITDEEKMQLMSSDAVEKFDFARRQVRNDPGTFMPKINGVPVNQSKAWQDLEAERAADQRRRRG